MKQGTEAAKMAAKEAAKMMEAKVSIRAIYVALIQTAYDVRNVEGTKDNARSAHEFRIEVGKILKDATKDKDREAARRIKEVNIQRYGNEWGPTFESLEKKGKTYKQIIESSFKTGGIEGMESINRAARELMKQEENYSIEYLIQSRVGTNIMTGDSTNKVIELVKKAREIPGVKEKRKIISHELVVTENKDIIKIPKSVEKEAKQIWEPVKSNSSTNSFTNSPTTITKNQKRGNSI